MDLVENLLTLNLDNLLKLSFILQEVSMSHAARATIWNEVLAGTLEGWGLLSDGGIGRFRAWIEKFRIV